MFSIEMLPADHGDCLWIEYGREGGPARRVLIDGGTPSTYGRLKKRIEALDPDDRRFDLFLVTHIDSDHIGGAVKLLEQPPEGLSFGDVWFNGFRHLPKPEDELGVRQGEELTRALVEARHPWNQLFQTNAVVAPDEGAPPRVTLEGGMSLTILSPGLKELRRLYPVWDKEMAKLRAEQGDEGERVTKEDELGSGLDVAALAASPFKQDRAGPNGSSIAVLAEWEGKRVLLAADAHPSVLIQSIDKLLTEREESALALDAFKVAHHGSRANTSRQLLEKLDTKQYLVSTNGAVFHHPDREGVARVIAYGGREKTLFFNYRTAENEIWLSDELENEHRYNARFQNRIELSR